MNETTIEKMIYLISCSLQGNIPDSQALEPLDGMELFSLAKIHSLTSIVAMALEKTTLFSSYPQNVRQRWIEEKNKAIRKSMLLDRESQVIYEEMERCGIWYMPLKGAILKDLYPKYGMRQMADIDVLYDASKQNQLMKIFKNRGYDVKLVGVGVHDIYLKEPVYNFEMHRMLFSENLNNKWCTYYQNIQDKFCLNPGKNYKYHLTNEDFYIHMMAHAYKHYSHSGTGLRTLVDIYVYEVKYGQTLNRSYIDGELKILGIEQFEKKSRQLARKIFGSDHMVSLSELMESEENMLMEFCLHGVYGTSKRRVENELKSMQGEDEQISYITRIKYCLSRVFPGRKWCKTNIPFFYKYPILLPALWIYRIFRNLFFRNKALRTEIKAVINVDKK